MSEFDYDLFVIGGGSGGVRAARIAATHGARVAVAESSRFGGTCVIRGCVPKKLLVYASRFADDFHDAAGFGWDVGVPTHDWSRLIANKDREIARLEAAYQSNLVKAGVETIAERATIAAAHTIRLASGRQLSARRILVATGGRPFVPTTLKGSEHAITSDEAFDLKRLPARIAIAGAGYIALEFACIFAGLGSKVTIVHRGDRLLRHFDHDLSEGLLAAMQARGIDMRLHAHIDALQKEGDAVRVALADGSSLVVDEMMLATGRVPNTAGIGLEAIGVELDVDGAIPVDTFSRTRVEHVFAIGDATNRVNLTPVAIREGHAFADSEFGPRPWVVDYDCIPTAVFTTPELGTVGLTEAAAIERHGIVDVYRTEFRSMKATLAGSRERVMMKLLVDVSTDRIVGAHLMGPDAAEMAQVLATLLRLGATKRDLDQTMPLHPSAAEELVTMRTATARRTRR